MHIFFLFKTTKHICFNDTNNVTNIISYNINSYLFERQQKYGIVIIEIEKTNYFDIIYVIISGSLNCFSNSNI